jgi:hypothetical protein
MGFFYGQVIRIRVSRHGKEKVRPVVIVPWVWIDRSLSLHYFEDTGMQAEAREWRTVGTVASGDTPRRSSMSE